jgi:tellurium resistance protein TerD
MTDQDDPKNADDPQQDSAAESNPAPEAPTENKEPEFPPMPDDFMADDKPNIPPVPDAAAPPAAPAAPTEPDINFLSDDKPLNELPDPLAPIPPLNAEDKDGSSAYDEKLAQGDNPIPDMDDPIFDYLGPAPKQDKKQEQQEGSNTRSSVMPPDSFDDEEFVKKEKSNKKERTEDGALVNKDILDAEKELEEHLVKKGDVYNLTEKSPSLNSIVVGAGWDQRAFEEDSIDADLSIFLLNKDLQTREDEDFVFYNQPKTLEGAVEHLTDSRTGAGEGDDEDIRIDLNGIPFEVTNIMIVLSIYDPEYIGHRMEMLKNCFVRLFENDDKKRELVRYIIEDDDLGKDATGIYAAQIMREGPIWKFEAIADPVKGGLAKIAADYGIIIRELQSSANTDD